MRSRSYSKPARIVCFPCDQEIWSAASHALEYLIFPNACWPPNTIKPVTVSVSRKLYVGSMGAIPTCVSVNGTPLLGAETTRCTENRASFTTLLERTDVSFATQYWLVFR